MDFNFASFIDSTVGLFAFMSKAYGTGNLAFDGFLVGFFCLAVIFVVSLMQMAGYNRTISNGGSRDVALLEDVAELLNELNLQVSEMHGSVVHEFHRCRGELGAIRQDMVDLKTAIQTRPSSHSSTFASSTTSTGSTSKRPTFYGGKRGDLSGLRGFSN